MNAIEIERDFRWGEVITVHEVGPYVIVEYLPNRPGNAKDDWEPLPNFSLFVDGYTTSHSYSSLDHALVAGVVWRNEETNHGVNAAANERLSGYVMRVLST